MATVSKHECDQCSKTVADPYATKKWVQIYISKLSISHGRRKNGSAKSAYASDRKLDFCGLNCFYLWIADLEESAKSKRKKTKECGRWKSAGFIGK